MNRRLRNIVLFVASVLGTALLFIGILGVSSGDESSVRAIIGGVFAFALAAVVALRSRNAQRPDA